MLIYLSKLQIYSYKSFTQIEILFQGRVIFLTEETGSDGTVSKLEYVCDNKLGRDFLLIGMPTFPVTSFFYLYRVLLYRY